MQRYLPQALTEDEFLTRIDTLVAADFAGAPAGRVAVEALDELDRIEWRAYFPNASSLVILARQIREGRAAGWLTPRSIAKPPVYAKSSNA